MEIYAGVRKNPSGKILRHILLQNEVATYPLVTLPFRTKHMGDHHLTLADMRDFLRGKFRFCLPIKKSYLSFMDKMNIVMRDPEQVIDVNDELRVFAPTMEIAAYRNRYVVTHDKYRLLQNSDIAAKFNLKGKAEKLWLRRPTNPEKDNFLRERLFLILQSHVNHLSLRFYLPDVPCLCRMFIEACEEFPKLTCPRHGNILKRKHAPYRKKERHPLTDVLIRKRELLYCCLDGFNPVVFGDIPGFHPALHTY